MELGEGGNGNVHMILRINGKWMQSNAWMDGCAFLVGEFILEGNITFSPQQCSMAVNWKGNTELERMKQILLKWKGCSPNNIHIF